MSSSSRVKVAVVGASGYTGRELLRLLFLHPHAEVTAVTSRTLAGKPLVSEFPRFRGLAGAEKLSFVAPDVAALVATGAEAVFLALPHGVASEYAKPLLAAGLRVLDLSADFRLRDAAVYAEYYAHEHPSPELLKEAVYALPEVRPEAIRQARLIACPGCYPTSVLLPLVPLLKAGLLDESPISVSSMSGVSGAGREAKTQVLFCECNESVRSYGVPKHRHISEIGQELDLAAGRAVTFSFVPHLVPINQGICTTIFAGLRAGVDVAEVEKVYAETYADKPFVRVLGNQQCPDTKNVSGTNFLDLGWAFDARAKRLILMSAEDNLVKGAAGQAVQNLNLAFGFAETAGLLLV